MPPTGKNRKTGATARKQNPPQQSTPQNDPYAPTAWGGSAYEDLRLPSGQLCLARRMGVEGLMKAGIIHDIDPLMGMVQMHEARVAGKDTESNEKAMLDILKDESKMTSLFHMLDRIVCAVAVKPEVKMTPNDVTRRQDGVIYTDMIDLEDKMFIMMWTMGGAETVAGFRDQFEKSLGSLSAQPKNGGQAE